MAYIENIAPKRANTGSVNVSPAPALAKDSNQVLSEGQSSLFRTPAVATGKYNEGGVVKLASNNKGTGVAGRPTALGAKG